MRLPIFCAGHTEFWHPPENQHGEAPGYQQPGASRDFSIASSPGFARAYAAAASSLVAGTVSSQRRRITDAFCPPKPNEFDIATFSGARRETFGT